MENKLPTSFNSSRKKKLNRAPACPNKIVQNLFKKTFSFCASNLYVLPDSDILYTEPVMQIEPLQRMKADLNNVKSKLNDFPIEKWSEHTRRRNPAANIVWRLKNDVGAEFVTNAWCKIYEILHQYRIVQGPKLNSLHLCEAPGAFISGLNHYLHSYFENVEWKWMSTTLNPYYEGNPLSKMIVDDRFMLHTLENWSFGLDFTGNIINRENVEHLAQRAAEQLGPVDLITADGSIDCTDTPERQEEMVSALHFAETVAALKILTPGGCFILKMFTFFEACSVNLIYFLNCVFSEVHVFKPCASRAGNSEVYVICLNFNPLQAHFKSCMEKLLNHLEDRDLHKGMFPLEKIPPSFLEQIRKCTEYFTKIQANVIESNIFHYLEPTEYEIRRTTNLRILACNFFFQCYRIGTIAKHHQILHNQNSNIKYGNCARILTGSYTERSLLKTMSDEEKLEILRKEFLGIKENMMKCSGNISLTLMANEIPPNDPVICISMGHPIRKINSSLFLNNILMRFLSKVLQVSSVFTLKNENMYSVIKNDDFPMISENIDKFFRTDDYNRDEKEFFHKLFSLLLDSKPKVLILHQIPILTHFSCSIIFYLRFYIYKTFEINSTDHTILFKDVQEDEVIHHKLKLYELQDLVFNAKEKPSSAILSFINIKSLHQIHFKESLIDYNSKLLLKYCSMLLSL